MRDQAFALFAKKYDELRRAVWFVRWQEGDADEYAPSLYAGRGSRKSDETAPAEPPAAGNVTAAPAPTAPPAPAMSAAAPNPAPAGAPGSSPFIA